MSATIKQPIALVTGMEHAGTTYLSSLIKCHPLVNGDFECGVLLAESPADFRNISPFYGWMLRAKNPKQWGISEDKMEIILAGSIIQILEAKMTMMAIPKPATYASVLDVGGGVAGVASGAFSTPKAVSA